MDYIKDCIGKFIETKVKATVIGGSYWICLFVGLGALIAYMCGYKKANKITWLSIVIYWIVMAICSI